MENIHTDIKGVKSQFSGLAKFKKNKSYNDCYQHKQSDGPIMH